MKVDGTRDMPAALGAVVAGGRLTRSPRKLLAGPCVDQHRPALPRFVLTSIPIDPGQIVSHGATVGRRRGLVRRRSFRRELAPSGRQLPAFDQGHRTRDVQEFQASGDGVGVTYDYKCTAADSFTINFFGTNGSPLLPDVITSEFDTNGSSTATENLNGATGPLHVEVDSACTWSVEGGWRALTRGSGGRSATFEEIDGVRRYHTPSAAGSQRKSARPQSSVRRLPYARPEGPPHGAPPTRGPTASKNKRGPPPPKTPPPRSIWSY